MSEELQSLVQIIELYGRGLEGLGKAIRFSAKGAEKGVQIARVKALQHRMKLHYASEGTHNTMKLSDLEKMTGGRYTILNIPLEDEKELIAFYDRLKKLKVSFSELPDLNLGDGYTQIAYNPDDVESVRLVIDYYKKKFRQEAKEMDLDEYFGTATPGGLEYLDELAAKGYEGRMHEEQLEEIQERIRDKEYLPISINVESLLLREEKDAYLFRIPRGRLGEDLSSAIRIKKSDCILLDEGQTVITCLKRDEELWGYALDQRKNINEKEKVKLDITKLEKAFAPVGDDRVKMIGKLKPEYAAIFPSFHEGQEIQKKSSVPDLVPEKTVEKVLSLEKMKERYQSPEYIPVTFDMETQMVAESPNLYIANLPKEQQESKDFVRCICLDNNQKRGWAELLQKNWKTILYLLDEAQFVDADTPPKLDLRMEELAKKKPDHPAVKAYQRYRGGPDETIRSVIMTVNARMQPFDNEELLEIFSSNDIPLDEFGTGIDGDKKTKSNLFIIIPDDDDTFNFVPGMVYTLFFQELYRQARFFGGKLPMDVGFWLDEMANIKMPNNFDKILATCRSRGVYCVPILQSLAQLKTLFADGAWEGIVGNCDTFIYLGGNEASTYEYVSKLLGKWTIDKRTSGESKGSSGSYSQNYDVLGRELMLEYELRLLPDDECIIFVRGENPIRDKKWFPWEHEQYLEARKCGAFNPKEQQEKQKKPMEECEFLGEESLNYLKLQKDKNENIRLYELDAFSFMMMDLDEMEKKIHSTPNDKKGKAGAPTITAGMIQSALHAEKEREEAERKAWFVENFDSLTLLDIYASEWIGEIRRNVIRDLLQAQAPEEVIKSIIRPEIEEGQVLQKKKMWMEMEGRERIEE